MVIVKYTCPQCKTILEVKHSTVERIVQCKKCKTKINLIPLPKEKLSLKQKQKWCLWIGTGIMDLFGVVILYDRVVYRDFRLKWSALDAFFLITLIIITTAVFFYTLSLTDEKPKNEEGGLRAGQKQRNKT